MTFGNGVRINCHINDLENFIKASISIIKNAVLRGVRISQVVDMKCAQIQIISAPLMAEQVARDQLPVGDMLTSPNN